MYLFLSTLLLFMLPLLPTINELLWPTDNQPLRVVQEYDRNIRHFAVGFRQYITKNLSHLLNEPGREGTLADGTRFRTAGKDGIVFPHDRESLPFLMISSFPLTLPEGHFYEAEIYSQHGITAGGHNTFRAMMAEEDILLGDYNSVLRWVHTAGQLHAGVGCTFFGRASADVGIHLSDESVFERMSAPIIEMGPYLKQDQDVARAQGPRTLMQDLPRVRENYGKRWLLEGVFDFPEQHFFEGDIISGKAMNIGAYAHIKGSLKSNDDCHIGAHVCVEGSTVSTENIYIGPGCIIAGPVIAENTISIAAGSIIGAPGKLTSITAPRIFIEPGAIIYGTLWAMEDGQVRKAGQSLKASKPLKKASV